MTNPAHFIFYTYFCKPCGGLQYTGTKSGDLDLLPIFRTEMLANLNMPEHPNPEHPMSVCRVRVQLYPTPDEMFAMSKEMQELAIEGISLPLGALDELCNTVIEFNANHGTDFSLSSNTIKPPV